jgi:hypothetical protein
LSRERISYKTYRQEVTKISKYRNKKTEVDGIRFDSKKEADHYCELKLKRKRGEITDFFRQVPFVIGPQIVYRADFVVIPNNLDLKIAIHEVKGMWTAVAKLKMKLFRDKYPDYYVEII